MTSIIRLLLSTFHPATGAVRSGEVVEVPDELAAHWTNSHIAEDATGQEVTRHTATEVPTGQDGPNEYGQWPAPRPLGEPEPATPAPSAGNFSSMTSRNDVGMAPAEPAAVEPAPAPEPATVDPQPEAAPAPESPAPEPTPEPTPEPAPESPALEPTPPAV